MSDSDFPGQKPTRTHPFRRAVLRGFAVVLPPLLTVVIFVWIGSTVNQYVLKPVSAGAREMLVLVAADVRKVPQPTAGTLPDEKDFDGIVYHILPSNEKTSGRQYVPRHVYVRVADALSSNETMPSSGQSVYRRYAELQWLQPQFVIPVFTCVFILVLYLLGKFLAAGIGRFFLANFEKIINRLPLIRNVYGSVKQVTDFVFSESQVEYTRVVAIEYPRKGVWSLGLVTGESMLDISAAANEPVLSVLIPSSPMPVTGYTVTVKKSEAVDLNLSVDQAFQFVVSCGVVVPSQQMQLRAEVAPSSDGDNGQTAATAASAARLPAPDSDDADADKPQQDDAERDKAEPGTKTETDDPQTMGDTSLPASGS